MLRDYFYKRFLLCEKMMLVSLDGLRNLKNIATSSTRWNLHDVSICLEETQNNYLIILYSEFEAALRHYWEFARHRKTYPKMEILIEKISAYRQIDPSLVSLAHQVREYRNFLLHRNGSPPPIQFKDARRILGRFLSHLPPSW